MTDTALLNTQLSTSRQSVEHGALAFAFLPRQTAQPGKEKPGCGSLPRYSISRHLFFSSPLIPGIPALCKLITS